MGPRTHLWFCVCKTAWLAAELLVSMGPRPQLPFCACKTTRLAKELLVYMRPSPHLLFLHAKQRLLDRNCKSLWVPDFTRWLYMRNSAISTRITNLYGTQPSSVVFAFKTATLWPELLVSMGPRHHVWFFCIQNSDFSTRIASLYGSQLSSVVLCILNSAIMTRINSLYGSQTKPVVLCM